MINSIGNFVSSMYRLVFFNTWENIDLNVFALQGADGFDGEESGAGSYTGSAKTIPVFSLGDAQSVEVTLDETYTSATGGTISILLRSDSVGTLDSGTISSNTNGQTFTLTNSSGQSYSDLSIRIQLFGFAATTNTKIRNMVVILS